MNTLELKNKIVEGIKNADEHLLSQIVEIIQNYSQKESGFGLSAEQKNILDARLAHHELNPDEGKSWEALKKELSAKYEV